MPIDRKHVKGRGATGNVPNRFQQRSYAMVHMEGVDEVEEDAQPTRFLETHARSIINRVNSPDLHFSWSMNPYQGCEHGCSYCYARPTHEYWGYGAGLDFERIVLVKRNAVELFEMELRKPSWKGEPISLSGATDPYQPGERVEQLTRGLLGSALSFGQPLMVITKNALITRDIDLLGQMAARGLVQVAISLTTLDEDLRRNLEPRTSTGQKRLEAMRALSEAGVPTVAMLAPIIPSLNEPEIPSLLRAAAEAGARQAAYTILRTNGSVGPVFEQWLRTHLPDRAEKILAQTSALHGGAMSETVTGRRMKGEGEFAQSIGRLFNVMRDRYFTGRSLPALNVAAFKPPEHGQLDLFRSGPMC